MNKFTIYIIIILFTSCKYQKIKYSEYKISPNQNISILLNSFIHETPNKYPVNEIYIDKISPHEYYLIFYSGLKSLTEKENLYENQSAITYTVIEGIKFKIFSGIEHYFKIQPQNEMKKNFEPQDFSDKGYIWILKDSIGDIKIYKDEIAYPFLLYPPSTIKFTEPQIKD